MTRNGSLPSTVEGTGISQAAGDVRYAQLGAANTFASGAQVFQNGFTAGYQSFTEVTSSLMGTISLTGGTIVEVLGNASGSTLQLPSSPPTGAVFCIVSSASQGFVLSGSVSGKNIAGSASTSMIIGQAVWIGYNGTQWIFLSFPPQANANVTGALSFTSTNTHSGTEVFTSKLVRNLQSFSATGTISATGGTTVNFTGSAGQTISLPSVTITSGMCITVKDESGNGFTLGRNGKNIDGAASDLSIGAYGTATVYYNGAANAGSGAWMTI